MQRVGDEIASETEGEEPFGYPTSAVHERLTDPYASDIPSDVPHGLTYMGQDERGNHFAQRGSHEGGVATDGLGEAGDVYIKGVDGMWLPYANRFDWEREQLLGESTEKVVVKIAPGWQGHGVTIFEGGSEKNSKADDLEGVKEKLDAIQPLQPNEWLAVEAALKQQASVEMRLGAHGWCIRELGNREQPVPEFGPEDLVSKVTSGTPAEEAIREVFGQDRGSSPAPKPPKKKANVGTWSKPSVVRVRDDGEGDKPSPEPYKNKLPSKHHDYDKLAWR
jgi:hypothetical protein